MSTLEWNKTGERFFETGVSNGVLYPLSNLGRYDRGYAWNGLTAVNDSPSGAENTKEYADNIPYLNMTSAEELDGTIEAFQSPREFDQCDGTATPFPGIGVGQQRRRAFGFSYQTLIGNDLDGQDHGYKIHVIYGAMAAPSERSNATVNDSPEAMTLSWEFNTTPVAITPEIVVNGRALRPTAKLTFSSLDFAPEKMTALKEVLYGTASTDARLPLPHELITMMSGTITEVTPTAPTYEDLTKTLTIPNTAGVVYIVRGNPMDAGDVVLDSSVVVTAIPSIGYRFPDVTPTQWVFIV